MASKLAYQQSAHLLVVTCGISGLALLQHTQLLPSKTLLSPMTLLPVSSAGMLYDTCIDCSQRMSQAAALVLGQGLSVLIALTGTFSSLLIEQVLAFCIVSLCSLSSVLSIQRLYQFMRATPVKFWQGSVHAALKLQCCSLCHDVASQLCSSICSAAYGQQN